MSQFASFLDAALPHAFHHRYLKKVCCADKDAFSFRDATPVTTAFFAAFDAALQRLAAALEAEQDAELIPALSHVRLFLNKYVCFSQEERDLLVRVKQALCALAIALNDPSSASAFAARLRPRQQEVMEAVFAFVTDLLSCFALNEECSVLFEGEIWTLASSCTRLMATMQDCGTPRFSWSRVAMRFYKNMNRIHAQNAFTIDEAVFNSLTLTLNSIITTILEAYCQDSSLHTHLLYRIFQSIST